MPVMEIKRTYPRTIQVEGRSITLRKMTRDDKQGMIDLAKTLHEEDLLFLRMDITRPEVVDTWVDSIETGRRITVLAEENGRLIGYGGLNRSDLTWTRHLGEIRIIVDRNNRGSGLGTALANEIFLVARDLGLTKIVAQMASEHVGARKVFERLGFRPEALLTDWVIDREGHTHDLVIMSYDVTGVTS